MISLILSSSLAFAANPLIKITDTRARPISSASVQVGRTLFATNADGVAEITEPWEQPQTINTMAANHIDQSYFQCLPAQLSVFEMRRTDLVSPVEVNGTPKDIQEVKLDGKIDFALVIPLFEKKSALEFEVEQLLSSQMDSFKVFNQVVEVPSNLSLPPQTEKYVINLKISKPVYRAFANQFDHFVFGAIHGQFPLKKVIDGVQKNKSFFSMLNYFEFLGSGFASIDLTMPKHTLDLATHDFIFTQTLPVAAPAVNADEGVLAITLFNKNNYLVPVDVKALDVKAPTALKWSSDANLDNRILYVRVKEDQGKLLTAAISKNFSNETTFPKVEVDESMLNSISLALAPATFGVKNLLPLIPPPVQSERHFAITPPELPASSSLQRSKTRIIYSDLQKTTVGKVSYFRRIQKWRAEFPGWATDIEIPEDKFRKSDPNSPQRVEITYYASEEIGPQTSPDSIESLVYATRNSIDF